MNIVKKILGAGLAVALSFSIAGTALAYDEVSKTDTISAQIKAGSFNIESYGVNSFGEIEIEREVKTYYTSLKAPVKVTDLRGTGEGWAVTVSATPLTHYRNGEAKYSLPKGSLTLGNFEAVGENRSSGHIKIGVSNYDKALHQRAIIDDGEVLVLNVEQSGMGVYDLHFADDAIGLIIDPFTSYAGEFESIMTWTLHATPKAL